jgi:hypothetical protein
MQLINRIVKNKISTDVEISKTIFRTIFFEKSIIAKEYRMRN